MEPLTGDLNLFNMSDKRPRRDGPLSAIHFLVLAGALLVPASTLLATPGINPPAELTVGFHLQTFTSVRLTEQAPEGGLQVTITSDDPSRLLLAEGPNQPGSKSITLKVNSLYVETPDFYLGGLADSGTATYTITAPTSGYSKGNSQVRSVRRFDCRTVQFSFLPNHNREIRADYGVYRIARLRQSPKTTGRGWFGREC